MKRTQPIGNRQSALRNGFTLIEVMLVVVIILIATAIAIPSFRGTFKSTQMTDAVRTTVRTARFARSMSILKQADCSLIFKDSKIELTCDQEKLTVRRLPDGMKLSGFKNLAGTDQPDEGGHTVHYYAGGMNDGFELTLSDDKDRRRTISCNPITGKVSIEE